MTDPALDSVNLRETRPDEAPHEDLEAEALVAMPGFARFTSTSAVFAMGSVVGKVVGFLMLPVLTRSLTPSDFGSLDVLISLFSAIAGPLLLGLDVATIRLYFDQVGGAARGRLIGTSYVLALGAAIVAGSIIALTSGAVSTTLFGSLALQPAVLATGAAVIGGALRAISMSVLRAQSRGWSYAAVSAGALIAYAVITVTLLTLWRADVTAVLVAYAAALFLSGAAGTMLVGLRHLGRPTASAAGALLRLGLPLTPAVAATYGADFLNRTILLDSAGASDVALFTVALRFASVAGIVVTGFQLALPPRAFALGTSEAARRRLAIDARWVVALVEVAVLVLAVSSPELVVLVAGSPYAGAVPALGFCLVFILAEALFLVASLPSAMAKATVDLALATGSGVVVALVGNYLVAPIWHSTGTAAALAVGQLVGFIVVRQLGVRRLPLLIDWLRLGLVAGVIGIASLTMLVSAAPLVARIVIFSPSLALIVWSVPSRAALDAFRSRFFP